MAQLQWFPIALNTMRMIQYEFYSKAALITWIWASSKLSCR